MLKWYQFETLAEKWTELNKNDKYLPKSLPKFLEKVNEGCYLSTVTELRDWWSRLRLSVVLRLDLDITAIVIIGFLEWLCLTCGVSNAYCRR